MYETDPIVLPWNPPRKAITACRPDVLRASLTAASTASAPELAKPNISIPGGVISASRSADLDDRLVAEDASRVGHPPHLLHGGCDHLGVVVSQVGHRGAAGEIGPPVAFVVVNPEAFGAFDHDVGVEGENWGHGRVGDGR